MPTGRIKYYNFDKGFGFIAQDNSKADVFLHSSAIKQLEYEELRVGQRVKYNVIEGEKGLIAQNVEILLTPTERRWLRQGKSIIPRGYAGFPGQSHGQFADESATPTAHQQPRESETFRERQGRNTPLASSKRASEAPSQSASTRGLGTTEAATPELQKQLSHRLSFGDLYILKQINLETPMFFALYHSTHLPAIVLENDTLHLHC